MAVEAGRSPGGSADSYIGCLISLTSKSDIRYEGLLFNINTHESSIGLKNVRSFGTEGRKKDGPQVPPSGKVYEYILFRGSDIKDLQVKSSPPVQTATPIHNDPAIIQTPAASTSLASSGPALATDLTFQTGHVSGLPRPTFQSNLPLYQPGGSLGSWGPTPTPQTTNGTGLAMPMYWQGYYGSSNGFQAQPQSLLQPPPGLSFPISLQQTMQYPAMNETLPTGHSNLLASQLSETPSPLLPPISTGSLAQSSATVSDWSTSLVAEKPSSQALSAAAPSTSLLFVSPLPSDLDKPVIAPTVNAKPKTIPSPIMPFKNVPEPVPSVAGRSSSISNEVAMPSLVTPDQLLQSGPTTVSSLQSPRSAQKDVEVVQVSTSESPPAVGTTEAQEPLLPLPSQPNRKQYRAPAYTQTNIRRGRGRGRGRGNGVSHSVTRFSEDFDFTAMNEKFNKDELWGDLGKSSKPQEDEELVDENEVGSSNNEPKPVYVKDDFFDSLSCDALNRGSYGGRRTRFSEQMKLDTETFGEFSRNRGGRGPHRGGRHRGGYYGRGSYGNGYGGRGRAPPH